ncbi:heme ABC transporter ATP-binding protein [Neolewinella aurantiaca]|uniref:Heme ABC transporter ATP-binding protein n=1 Tax=Neolewinella aurantiaca TaxID=2602767 RepID=A0A5C7F2K4_9BACT|nr:heme ABC transporter ATP-binding protein [Neolewinella aurantiaca]TXF84385.1 heme ABC transporter ATP-binding protein [Neolewinella aurantiaca]
MMRAEKVGLKLNGRNILRDIDCTVTPGRVTVVMGKNGAGKSTLLQIMAGQVTQGGAAGAVSVDGKAMQDIPSAELAGRRAVLAQSVQLGFPLPVAEVVELGCYARYHQMTARQRKSAVAQYLELLDITRLKNRSFPTLSGGEQKRVLLAKCLLQLDVENPDHKNNRYLLLDEPTAALDLEQQYRFVDLATRLARERGLGVLAVLHDLNLAARFADDLLFLRNGETVAAGPTTKVLTKTIIQETFNVDCLIQPHPCFNCPLITTLPYGKPNIAPALAP